MIKIQEVKQDIPREHRTKYWYFTRHGITVPKGAEILDIIEDGWDTYILLNNKLTPQEVDEYDMKMKDPPYELLLKSREMQRHKEKEQSGFGKDYLTFDYDW